MHTKQKNIPLNLQINSLQKTHIMKFTTQVFKQRIFGQVSVVEPYKLQLPTIPDQAALANCDG